MSTSTRTDLPRTDPTCVEPEPTDLDVVPLYSQLVGQIVDRYAEVSTVSTRLRMLLHESAAVVEELSLPSLHRRIVQAAVHLVEEAQGAALAVLSPDGVVVQLVQLDDEVEVVGSLPLDLATSATLTTLLQPLPAMAVSRLGPDRSGTLPAPWATGFTAIPVHHRRVVLAVLLVVEPERGLSTEDVDMLLSLAASAGTAIENARLYEEARRRQEWLQEAADLSGRKLPVATENEAVQLVTHSVQKLADAELVAGWVPEGDGLRLTVALGDQAPSLAGLRLRLDDPLITEVAASARGLHLDVSDRQGSGCLDALAQAGIGPVMVLPLRDGAGLRGLLLTGRHVGRPCFGDVDLDMAETFLGHVVMAMELVRARSVQERVAQLEDRERIARALHDHVASWLLSTGLKVQSTAGFSNDPRIHVGLQEVVEDLDGILQRVRDSIFPLDEVGSAAAGEGRLTSA